VSASTEDAEVAGSNEESGSSDEEVVTGKGKVRSYSLISEK
jgi:hypothetical protein